MEKFNSVTDFEKQLIEGMRNENKRSVIIPEHDELLLCLHRLSTMMTGRLDIDFCNSFIREAIQLLINSIFLYEEGNFECAFYSIRQASEVANNMLYLSSADKSEFYKWKRKEHFPMDSELVKKLKKINSNYEEVKDAISDFFTKHDSLIRSAHKIIHKQGFDTFYTFRVYEYYNKFDFEAEIQFFLKLIKSSIGKVIILFIIMEPLSLVLADDDLSGRFNFDPITEAVDVDFFKRYLSEDIIEKIKNTAFFKDFSSQFAEKEKMTPATFDVVRNNGFDLDALDEIQKQKHLLSLGEQVVLEVLQAGIRISRIYPDCLTIGGYFTSLSSNCCALSWDRDEYENNIKAKEIFNQPYKNVFRSILKVFNSNWIFEHNELLYNNQIDSIRTIAKEYSHNYEAKIKDFEQQNWE